MFGKIQKLCFVFLLFAVLTGCGGGKSVNSGNSSESGKLGEKDNLYPILQSGKIGYIDKTGKVVVQPQYESISEEVLMISPDHKFHEGLAAVKDSSTGKFGYIDNTGKLVIGAKYEKASEFREDSAVVTDGGKVSFIDRTGKQFVSETFDNARPFSEGLAVVVKNEKVGFIDKSGKMVVEPKFYYDEFLFTASLLADTNSFSDGVAAVGNENNEGYIDKTGNWLLKPTFGRTTPFHGGVAIINDEKKGISYIDKSGKIIQSLHKGKKEMVKDLDMEIVSDFETRANTEGLYVFGQDGKFGFMDKSGSVVIEPTFEATDAFNGGLAPAKQNGKFGFIDKTGKMVIEAKFDKAESFADGLALVELNGKQSYIDKDGKTVWTAS